jgi:hypothetical protein
MFFTVAGFREGIFFTPVANGLDANLLSVFGNGLDTSFLLVLGKGLDGIFLFAVGNLLDRSFAMTSLFCLGSPRLPMIAAGVAKGASSFMAASRMPSAPFVSTAEPWDFDADTIAVHLPFVSDPKTFSICIR